MRSAVFRSRRIACASSAEIFRLLVPGSLLVPGILKAVLHRPSASAYLR